jgi:DNA polymerase I-like protein with 3'-5' exonuclease and polymerase domains
MVGLDKIFRQKSMKARIVMMIHDSIWVEVPVDAEDEVHKIMKAVMTAAGNLTVPLEVDFE